MLLTQVVESIVMTGGYEDDVDDGDYVVYTSKSALKHLSVCDMPSFEHTHVTGTGHG